MIPIDAIVDAFIDANILIIVAFCLWSAARLACRPLGLDKAPALQLKLLNGVFVAVAASPLLILAHGQLQSSGLAQVNVNLSDMIVSHYLSGGFDMNASQFERAITFRETLTQNIASAAGWLAFALIAAVCAGLAVGLGRLTYSMICLGRIVARSYAWRSNGQLRLRLSDTTLVPFSTRGLRNYYVVLPSHMLTKPQELRVSLAHEFQHLRQGDIEWEFLLEALKPVFFLNPAFHAWKRQVEALRELSCDSAVLSRGRITARQYCDTLLSICQQSLRRDRLFVVAVPKVTLVTAERGAARLGRPSALERRLTALLDTPRLRHTGLRHPRLLAAAFALPLIAAVMLTALAIQQPGDWSQDRLMLSTVVNLERLDEINRLTEAGRVRN